MGKKFFNKENNFGITLNEFLDSECDTESRVPIYFKLDKRIRLKLSEMAEESGIQKTRIIIIAIKRFIEKEGRA
jgi:hypothetical protein